MENTKKGRGRPIHLHSPWGELAEAVGGSEKLAEKLSVAKSTMNRWAHGVSRIPELAKKEIRRLCKYHDIECQL